MDRRTTYRICPYCGATLDPGERCDCRDKKPPSMVRTLRTAERINLTQPIQKHYTPFHAYNQGGNRPWAKCRAH